MTRDSNTPETETDITLKWGTPYTLTGFSEPLLFFGWYDLPRAGFKERDAVFLSRRGVVYFPRPQLRALNPTPSDSLNSNQYAQSQPKCREPSHEDYLTEIKRFGRLK